MKRIFPGSFYNITTLLGAAIAALSLGLILFLMLLELLATNPKPYMGILAFVILPTFLLLGLAIGAAGIWREHRRERAGKPHGMHLPVVDLNSPRHRTAVTFIGLGGVLLLLLSGFGSFKAYEYTDSDEFCGTTCHKVMAPEYTAYQNSPHARVGCVKCHIGSGAGWFVRSKVSGSYQVYSTLFNKYPRPIPTPIQNLRPAQETCEQCHWPKHFYNEKLQKHTYFLSDENNTRWTLQLLLKVGGGNVEAGPTSGIHWHMNIANEITYSPSDSTRQVIPWVRSKRPDGTVVVYKSTEVSVSDSALAAGMTRRMDCIDCHNRPSHIYRPPKFLVDQELDRGGIDPTLPSVKLKCIEVLEASYTTTQHALDSIKLQVEEFYRGTYPAIAAGKQEAIARTVASLQRIYQRNYFPEMNVSWKKFPNNIGHMYYPGCFRCHDGKHLAENGTPLSRDCSACHTILAQKFQSDSIHVALNGLEYQHPVDIGDAWKETNCSECHSTSP
jgi:hypothetical protein